MGTDWTLIGAVIYYALHAICLALVGWQGYLIVLAAAVPFAALICGACGVPFRLSDLV